MTLQDYNTCVDQHSDGVYRFALKHLRDKDTAKDVVQESFARLWQKVEEVDAAKAKSYLFTTATPPRVKRQPGLENARRGSASMSRAVPHERPSSRDTAALSGVRLP